MGKTKDKTPQSNKPLPTHNQITHDPKNMKATSNTKTNQNSKTKLKHHPRPLQITTNARAQPL